MAFPQNAYPGMDNFQEVSFPVEVTPPDVDPDVDVQCVSYNPEWARVLMAACSQLTQVSAWKGTIAEKNLAVSRALTLKERLQKFGEGCNVSCCNDPFGQPIISRVDGDGNLQVSNDGGETWVNDSTDPRITQPSLPPISGGGDLSCQAASNIVAAFKTVQHDLAVLLTGTVALLALATDIAGIIAVLIFDPTEAYRLVPVVLHFAETMVSETETEFNDQFTDAVWHELLCAVQCTIGTDGVFDLTELANFKAELATRVTNAVCLNCFNLIAVGVGLIGMNNMGGQSATLEDCSDCACNPCDMTTWNVLTNGEIVGTPTSSLVTINGTLNAGSYRIDWTAHWSDFDASVAYTDPCCTLYFRTVSGGESGEVLNQVCGQSYNAGLHHPPASPVDNTWLIEYDSPTPIQVQISTNPDFT